MPANDAGAQRRVFCFPYAGGGTIAYRGWSRALSPDLSVCPIALPGREYRLREPLETNLLALVEALLPALPLDKPFCFYGHSMGALLAFEAARALRRRGLPGPLGLIVSACRPPQGPFSQPVHHLSDDLFVEAMKRYQGIPQAVLAEPELMAMALPILRADIGLFEEYQYRSEAPLECQLTALAGLSDGEATPEQMRGWQLHSRGPFQLRTYAGGHFFIQSAASDVLSDLENIVNHF